MRADRAAQDHAGLLQHPQPRRTDLPGSVDGQRQAAADRHPPRQPRRRGAAQGRGGDGRRQAARAGRDREPRPRHRLGRRRSRHPDGRAQGLVAAAAAHRPRQPPARRAERRASSCPATASNISRRAPRSTRSTTGELDPDMFRPGALDVLAQHILAVRLRRAVRRGRAARRDPLAPPPYAGLDAGDVSTVILDYIATGGYALKAYDRSAGWSQTAGGMWRIAQPAHRAAASPQRRDHRRQPRCSTSASATAASSARSRRGSPSTLTPGDTFFFAGLSARGRTVQGHRHHRPRLGQGRRGSSPMAGSACR